MNFNSEQIKKIIIIVVIIIAFLFIGLVILTIGASKKVNIGEADKYVIEVGDNTVVSDDIEEFVDKDIEIVSYSDDASYKVVLKNNKLYINIIDAESFMKTIPNSNVKDNDFIEIYTNNFKIIDVYSIDINDEKYVIALTRDGKIGRMNIQEAFDSNIFRLKNELVGLEKEIIKIRKVVKNTENKEEKMIVVVTEEDKVYNLQDLME